MEATAGGRKATCSSAELTLHSCLVNITEEHEVRINVYRLNSTDGDFLAQISVPDIVPASSGGYMATLKPNATSPGPVAIDVIVLPDLDESLAEIVEMIDLGCRVG